jgi:hypothetical protein
MEQQPVQPKPKVDKQTLEEIKAQKKIKEKALQTAQTIIKCHES